MWNSIIFSKIFPVNSVKIFLPFRINTRPQYYWCNVYYSLRVYQGISIYRLIPVLRRLLIQITEKHRYQWPNKEDWCPPNILKRKKKGKWLQFVQDFIKTVNLNISIVVLYYLHIVNLWHLWWPKRHHLQFSLSCQAVKFFLSGFALITQSWQCWHKRLTYVRKKSKKLPLMGIELWTTAIPVWCKNWTRKLA